MSKLRASGPRAPEVSIAIGTKRWDLDSRAYFSFLASAAVATALASLVASAMYEAAKVVKFQTRHWPDFHGAMELYYLLSECMCWHK